MEKPQESEAKKVNHKAKPAEVKSKIHVYLPNGARMNLKEQPADPPEPKYEVWQLKRPEERD